MKKYRQAASILVVKPSENGSFAVLLVHKPRKRDAWQLPQGGIEEGETLSEAALRELHEEAGVKIESTLFESEIRYKYDFSAGFHRRHNPVNDGQELLFAVAEAPADTGVTVDKREIDTFRWVRPENLHQFIKRKEYLDVVLELIAEYRNAHAPS